MREIKFRGYSKDYKKWCYGFTKMGWDGQWYIEFYINRSLQKYRVDENSIGQYTGFKDKNGVEIYEGDTVRDERGNTWIVFFGTDFGMWMIHTGEVQGVLFANDKDYEVIGNIYEEKLKKGK